MSKMKEPKKICRRRSTIQLPNYSVKKMQRSPFSPRFRDFLTRHKREETKSEEDGQGLALGTESPSRDSLGTSIEVQTGNSVGVLSVKEENVSAHHRVQKRARTQVFRLKEDWDDSTVISNISTKRIQNRLEATNRRERALAYAFSQQLRICSKKKQTKSDDTQPSMSWSWLERWMATRVPECSVESCTGKQLEPVNNNYTFDFGERFSDVAVEEKESCGSNEVSVQFDSLSIASNNKDGFKNTKSRLTRTISRRKTAPSYQCPTEQAKVNFPILHSFRKSSSSMYNKTLLLSSSLSSYS
ncbi:hypothetical protein OIU77_011038 [Salix suchowensis]|uniref:Protein IQ-DOMAIN 1 n=1 Tax=Salix suchowensis TaxID=1278906 RepID=A0ABQ9AAE1_9ROSI|nr:hypothetical protein OIU77_011038 [Salix suchowensis]